VRLYVAARVEHDPAHRATHLVEREGEWRSSLWWRTVGGVSDGKQSRQRTQFIQHSCCINLIMSVADSESLVGHARVQAADIAANLWASLRSGRRPHRHAAYPG